jgi:hypothetical protein
MLQFIFYAFLAYILYKLVFSFIIPVYKTTRQVRRGFRQMQEQMNQYQNGPYQQTSSEQYSQTTKENTKGDYIDFEEVK